MVADLDVINGRASMFYAADGGVPWHRDGTPTLTAVTSKEAAKEAGIDWEVEMCPLRLGDKNRTPVKGYKAIVRDLDRKTLGVVGGYYEPIQNRDCFEFLDSLVEDGVATYETAGAINGGKVVWMLMRLNSDWELMVNGNVQQFCDFLLATTSHDGTRAAGFWPTRVRVVCRNTLHAVIGGKAAVAYVRHHGDVSENLKKARELFKLTTAEMRRMSQYLEEAARTEVTAEQVEEVREEIFGTLDDATPTQRRKAIESFMDIYKEEQDADGRNAFALVNAVTGFADHKVRVTQKSSAMGSSLSGGIHLFKRDGLAAVSKVTGLTPLSKVAI